MRIMTKVWWCQQVRCFGKRGWEKENESKLGKIFKIFYT